MERRDLWRRWRRVVAGAVMSVVAVVTGCGRDVSEADVAPSSTREDSLAGVLTQMESELLALRSEASQLRRQLEVTALATGSSGTRDDNAPVTVELAPGLPPARGDATVDAGIARVLLRFPGMNGSRVTYVGESRNGQAEGIGYALWSTGSAYEGEWRENRRHGEGRHWYPDGARYEGTYQDDKREGQGTYYYRNGQRWEGPWQANLRHGEGVLYEADGRVRVRGVWESDRLKRELKP